MTKILDLKAAIKQTIDSGVEIGGFTVRMTCADERFRNPNHELHDQCGKLFETCFDDSRFEVIDVVEKGVFAVFDGYRICPPEDLEGNMLDFDTSLNEILDQYPLDNPDDGGNDTPKVGLNIGFLASAHNLEDLEGQDECCDNPDCDNH
jgi:hypothetical protein